MALSLESCGELLVSGPSDEPPAVERGAPRGDRSSVDPTLPVVSTPSAPDAGDSGVLPGASRKLVFVTQMLGPGQIVFEGPAEILLTGRAGADELCTTEANYFGLSGRFVAWLSVQEPGGDAIERLPAGVAFERPDGQLVFPDRSHIEEGRRPLVPITVSAAGAPVTDPDVWTATNELGRHTGSDCTGWSVITDTAVTGDPAETDRRWTNDVVERCSEPRRLLCFQL